MAATAAIAVGAAAAAVGAEARGAVTGVEAGGAMVAGATGLEPPQGKGRNGTPDARNLRGRGSFGNWKRGYEMKMREEKKQKKV